MISRTLTLFCLVGLCLTFVHCGGDDPKPPEPTQKEIVTEKLVAGGSSWSASTSGAGITVDGVDVTNEFFDGFTIKFTGTTLTTTGTTPVWLRTDTWTFKDDNATAIIRGQDNKEVAITSISDTELKLTLQWDQTTYEGGRTRSIPGTYVFTLKK
ncbi:MAG TPA: hypothetical protein VEB86_12245 [Chryseosolibacter sp.]|nr:hypothetical protein [Chryseosolibacter sp.]